MVSIVPVGGQTAASDIVYNAADQTTSIKIGTTGTNQVTEDYTFDPQTGLLTNQKATKNVSTTLLDLTYQYNRLGSAGSLNGKTGHLTKIIDNLNNAKNREYEFDALGRLTKAKGGSTGTLWNQTYSYDRYGNRTNVTATGVAADGSAIPRDGIPNLVYDNTSNRITTAGFEYDVNGNLGRSLAEDGVTWVKYDYDSANRLRGIRKDDAGQTLLQWFEYAHSNERLLSLDPTTNQWSIYASVGGTVLAEYTEFSPSNPTWVKSFTYFVDSPLSTITPNGQGGEHTEYNHLDRLGTRLITNQSLGTGYEQVTLPFGTALNAESTIHNNGTRFTSYDRSVKTGLDYAVNRTYDSKLGRFTQVDPIDIEASDLGEPQTLNLYTYCGNDPINHVDPDGLFFGKLFKAIGKFLKNLFTNKWFLLAVTIAVAILTIGAGMGLWSLSITITKSVTIPIFGGYAYTATFVKLTTLGWITGGLAIASAIPSLTSWTGLLRAVVGFAIGRITGFYFPSAISSGGTPDFNDGNSFILGQPRVIRSRRGYRGAGGWGSAFGRPPIRRREPRRVPGRRLPGRPDFGDLKDHRDRHAPFWTPEQYFEAARYNTEIGQRVKFYHNGQYKYAYITQPMPGQYIFTSTNLNGTRIFTHMPIVNSNYLRNLGINPRGIPLHFK